MADETQSENPMVSKPREEHHWLNQFVGEWETESECYPGPAAPVYKMTGTETVRSIGGLWVVAEAWGEEPDGGEPAMVLTLGFDPRVGRFVGTCIVSMMAHLWVYDGDTEFNAAEGKLSLYADGPAMHPGGPEAKMARYRDTFQILNENERTLTSHMLGDDGQWTQFMSARYRRKG